MKTLKFVRQGDLRADSRGLARTTPGRSLLAAVMLPVLVSLTLGCGSSGEEVVSQSTSASVEASGAPITEADIPASVLENASQIDVLELVTGLAAEHITVRESSGGPGDVDWRTAVVTALAFESEAKLNETYVFRGKMTPQHLPSDIPPEEIDVWIVVMRGLTLARSGPDFDNGDDPRSVNHEQIAFIDARTGESIGLYTFR